MKQEFSTAWKASKQPRKQRKYLANAPLHIKRKFVSVNLSKELRKKQEKRNVPLRKGDMVKVLRGKFSKKQGKVTDVNLKNQKIIVEGIQRQKLDGSKVNVPLRPSNLQIVELNLDDKRRFNKTKAQEQETKPVKKTTKKQAAKKTDSKELNKKPEEKVQDKDKQNKK